MIELCTFWGKVFRIKDALRTHSQFFAERTNPLLRQSIKMPRRLSASLRLRSSWYSSKSLHSTSQSRMAGTGSDAASSHRSSSASRFSMKSSSLSCVALGPFRANLV